MKKKTMITALLCAGALGVVATPVMKRLPISVLPENVFLCLGNFNYEDPAQVDAHVELLKRLDTGSTYNVVTFTLRCQPDLNDARTKELTRRFIERAHACGMQVMVDTDPRIARAKFLAERPDECERLVQMVRVAATNGVAVASAERKRELGDHMTGGTRPYETTASSLLGAWAVKRDGSGSPRCARTARGVATSGRRPTARCGWSTVRCCASRRSSRARAMRLRVRWNRTA